MAILVVALLQIIFVIILAYWFFRLILFIFKFIGVYKIAKAENIKYKALGFIPVVSNCYVGYIADCYNLKINKKSHYWIWGIIGAVLEFVFFLLAVIIIFLLIEPGTASIFKISVIAEFFIKRAFKIPFYIALYNVFSKIVPKSRVLFLVLSVIGLDWLMLFICGVSNKKAVDENSTEQIPQLLPDITEPCEKE